MPERLATLLTRLGLAPDAAYDPKWSAAPDFLELIADHALAARPGTIVECSSGITTVVLARCCALNGCGHVYSLENGPEFAARTQAELERLRLAEYATVIDAPLVPCPVDGDEYKWYDLTGFALQNIDMLVIDGPPGYIQRHSRYPALPKLYQRLRVECAIFLDDASRADEQEIVALWCNRFQDLMRFDIAAERGCVMLNKTTPAL